MRSFRRFCQFRKSKALNLARKRRRCVVCWTSGRRVIEGVSVRIFERLCNCLRNAKDDVTGNRMATTEQVVWRALGLALLFLTLTARDGSAGMPTATNPPNATRIWAGGFWG